MMMFEILSITPCWARYWRPCGVWASEVTISMHVALKQTKSSFGLLQTDCRGTERLRKHTKFFYPYEKTTNQRRETKTKPQLWNTRPSSLCFLMIYLKKDNFPGVFTLQPNNTTTTAYCGNFILVLKFKGFNEKQTQLRLKRVILNKTKHHCLAIGEMSNLL